MVEKGKVLREILQHIETARKEIEAVSGLIVDQGGEYILPESCQPVFLLYFIRSAKDAIIQAESYVNNAIDEVCSGEN